MIWYLFDFIIFVISGLLQRVIAVIRFPFWLFYKINSLFVTLLTFLMAGGSLIYLFLFGIYLIPAIFELKDTADVMNSLLMLGLGFGILSAICTAVKTVYTLIVGLFLVISTFWMRVFGFFENSLYSLQCFFIRTKKSHKYHKKEKVVVRKRTEDELEFERLYGYEFRYYKG